jgi:CHAT domain-containing protein
VKELSKVLKPGDRHLTDVELERLSRILRTNDSSTAHGNESEEVSAKHVSECPDCRRQLDGVIAVNTKLTSLQVHSPASRADLCPDDQEWISVAAGLVNESMSRQMLEHAASCDHCGPLLRAATEDLASESTPEENSILDSLESNHNEWQKRMATRLNTTARIPEPRPSPPVSWWKSALFRPRLALTASFILLIAFASVWYLRSRSETTPDRLLAEAYTQQRTLELRIPGAGYAPLRQERGAARSSLGKSSALLKAEFEIKEQLTANPENPTVLGAKGRAEILEWQYDEAIKSLKHALDLSPGSPELLCDLATAYVQRGDTENRAIDYGQAIEYLGEVLQKAPENKLALFNRAIAEERLQLVEQAAKDWEKYLQIDPKSEWANEARQRLRALQGKIKNSSATPHAEPDPMLAAHILEVRESDLSPNLQSWPASLDEDYLDIAVARWMPALAAIAEQSPAAAARSQELGALTRLSQSLLLRHHDNWLTDVLAAPRSQQVLDGWNQLALAVRLNSSGEFDSAARAATQAERLLRDQSKPAYLRALWERAYALQRAQQGSDCIAILEATIHPHQTETYPWLDAQLGLEHSICSAMVGQMRDTPRDVQSAASVAERAEYETLLLRAYHIMGIQAASQDPELAWRCFAKGLARHWAGAYRPFRAYQFYAEMSFDPEARGQWQLARTLMEEAVTHIARTPNRLMQAVARQSLAVDAQLAGDPSEALAEFREATNIFSSLPPSPSRDGLIFTAQVYQASLLSEEGQTEGALEALRAAKRISSRQSQYWVWLHYYQALGETEMRLGNTEQAELALHSAVYVSEAALANITNETDRVLWERHTARAYRSLVELEFENEHDPQAALETWQWYSSAPVRIPDAATVPTNIDFATLESDPPLPKSTLIAAALPRLTHSTVISVAEMNTGYLAWIFDQHGVESSKIAVAPNEVRREVRRLVRLCSDPSSDVAEIRKSGRQLYDWFLAPFAARLDPSRILVFEPDGPLRDAPIAVFVTPQGEFLAQRFALVVSPGLGYSNRLRKTTHFSPRDSILAIAIPIGAAPFKDLRLPPLPDSEAEAREISSYFARPHLLVGNQASLVAIERDLPVVRVLHFAGHAITNSTRSGLVLAAAEPVSAGENERSSFLDAEELTKLPLESLDLVVLSACETGDRDYDIGSPHGLVHAFVRAGVPEVIATQWDIDSHSTRELMNEFYQNLLGGQPTAVALQSATNFIRDRPESSHPYYWAAFTVFGAS